MTRSGKSSSAITHANPGLSAFVGTPRPRFANRLVRRARAAKGFTLLELLFAMGIAAILAMMFTAALSGAVGYARNARCIANLRQIGIAVHLYTQENNNTYPKIEANPDKPVYPPEDGAKSLLQTLSPYGITENILKCPADISGGPDAFKELGSSYQWLNFVDGERVVGDINYLDPYGNIIQAPASRVRMATDWYKVHHTQSGTSRAGGSDGRRNAVYADGHVGVSGE